MIAFLRDFVCKDFWLKLFSLALAAMVYFTVYYAKTDRGAPLLIKPAKDLAIPDVPITVISTAGTVPKLNVEPKTVEVTVQGDPSVIDRLKPDEVRVLVDLTGVPGSRETRKRVEVITPAGVACLKVRPDEVLVIYPPGS